EAPKAEANPFANPFTAQWAGAFANPALNPFSPAFDAHAAWGASQDAFEKLMADAYTRMSSFADDYTTLEAQMISRAQQAVQHWAQLAQDAIAYGAQLSTQARKIGMDTARAGMDTARKTTHGA